LFSSWLELLLQVVTTTGDVLGLRVVERAGSPAVLLRAVPGLAQRLL
jgi:hypothetical protein